MPTLDDGVDNILALLPKPSQDVLARLMPQPARYTIHQGVFAVNIHWRFGSASVGLVALRIEHLLNCD